MAGFSYEILDGILDDHASDDRHPWVAVETGTMDGDTTAVLSDRFDVTVTIEASDELYRAAVLRFMLASDVTVLHGCSEDLLPHVAAALSHPFVCDTLFYLDAHTWPESDGGPDCGAVGFPLWDELEIVRNAPCTAVVVVDDVLMFGRRCDEPGWRAVSVPRILEELGPRVVKHRIIGDQLVVWMGDAR